MKIFCLRKPALDVFWMKIWRYLDQNENCENIFHIKYYQIVLYVNFVGKKNTQWNVAKLFCWNNYNENCLSYKPFLLRYFNEMIKMNYSNDIFSTWYVYGIGVSHHFFLFLKVFIQVVQNRWATFSYKSNCLMN